MARRIDGHWDPCSILDNQRWSVCPIREHLACAVLGSDYLAIAPRLSSSTPSVAKPETAKSIRPLPVSTENQWHHCEWSKR
jgi:hypothetical protein